MKESPELTLSPLQVDGVEQLNNILLIGMTNRKDMIDEALLRPGRLEVQMEISEFGVVNSSLLHFSCVEGLPDENGRVEILNIHTSLMRKNGKLADDIDVEELAKKTRNFSGAELEGLVRSAQATAMNRLIKVCVCLIYHLPVKSFLHRLKIKSL